MSLNAVLSNALSGLAVAQNALAVTSNNVANANTPGYARQVAQQESVVIDGRGAGARAVDTTRVVDELLNARLREQLARAGQSRVLDSVHEQSQDRLFGAPGDADRGLGNLITRVAAAAETLATGPDQSAFAQGFVGAAEDLARGIELAGAEVQSLRRELDSRIAGTIADINGELAQLAEVNEAIGRSGAGPELLDRRDGLLAGLAEKLELAVAFRDDGSAAVYTRAGQPLLDASLRQLAYAPAAEVGPATSFGPIRAARAADLDPTTGAPLAGSPVAVLVSGGVRATLTPELAADATADSAQLIVSSLRGGTLQGLLEARDTLLPALGDQLAELASVASHALNAAHNAASPQPPRTALSGTRTDTAGFATASRGGTAYVAVIDSATGAVAATIELDIAAAPDAGGLAGQIAAGLGAFGTAGLAPDGRLELTAAAGYALAIGEGDSAIVATDSAGHARAQGFSHYFGLNDLLVGTGGEPTRLRVRDDLAADVRLLSRARLDVTAGPPATAQLGGAGDNRGAQALAAAFETSVATVARGGLPAGSFRLADLAAEIVALGAGAADRAKGAAANDAALADDLTARQAATSGVNLDEELARLVLYQEAYSVSARLIAITNQLFDDLLGIVG
jgi:flagellar hook-associated protein 1 FlgK